MQQVFNPLLLYFELVHFYNNAEKKRKSFRGKTPAFFLGVFAQKLAELNLAPRFASVSRLSGAWRRPGEWVWWRCAGRQQLRG